MNKKEVGEQWKGLEILCQMIFLGDAIELLQSPLGDLFHDFPPVLLNHLQM